MKDEDFKTEQEVFWSGQFGDDYIERNKSLQLLGNKTAFYARVLKSMNKFNSCLEFGSNIGLNLMALKNLLPDCECSAIEINEKAVEMLNKNKKIKVYNQSILDFEVDYQRELVFTHGVLIHINPEKLKDVYKLLYEASNQYILLTEYYNPAPVEIEYRGNKGKLFKRDFAGEMLDGYKDLKLIDYGFVYHRDNQFPQDDFTWFLLQKNGGDEGVK
ncbi:MAG: hypothetical protein PWP20_439 [Eubacteriaceae bacterium]|nr:hypothetical protein [Eubacteriaceae bacterium]